jgi:hypothetical protein
VSEDLPMSQKCWICEINEADSGEHVLKKSVLDFILGKPSPTNKRFISHYHGRRNTPVSSFKNKRFKFNKNICQRCNDTLTQPYDDAFDIFIRKLFNQKSLIINRGIINIQSLCGNPQQKDNLALFFMKAFGCLIVHHGVTINNCDFQALRMSLLEGKVRSSNVFLSLHRDLKKLSVKNGTLVNQLPYFYKDSITWTIDLDWISLILSYPACPPKKYGCCWHLGDEKSKLKLGKLT